jgi:galactokinase
MDRLADKIKSRFTDLFGKEPLMVRSPGRINLIGEHTDYNDGFVMPAAIDKDMIFAIAPSDTSTSEIYSIKYDEHIRIDLADVKKVVVPSWANYFLGVVHQILGDGLPLRSFVCVFGGEVPLGAGLSSSAALECGFAFSLNELFQLKIPKIRLIKMAQWAEHHFVGVKCGIMDQFASVMGKEHHVILLDCRSLEYRYAPIDLKDHVLILCDTKVKHSLVDSEYNTRREECETGVKILKKHYPEIGSLRDVRLEMLEAHQHEMPGKIFNRCLYVVEEIKRVQEASKDLEAGNLAAFGRKMYETHEGLCKLYEVSCKELDFMVNESKKFKSVVGARMMGGGFGGCTINIVKKDAADSFISHLTKSYRQIFSIDMPAYKVSIREGTSILSKSTASIVNE